MRKPEQIEALRIVAAGNFVPSLVREDDGWHARWKAIDPVGNTVNFWIDEAVRQAAVTTLSADAESQHHESLHDAWLMALKSKSGLVRWNGEECERFSHSIDNWALPLTSAADSRKSLLFKYTAIDSTHSRIECAVPVGVAQMRALGDAVALFGPLRAMRKVGGSGGSGEAGAGMMSLELSGSDNESFLRRGSRSLRDAGFSIEGCETQAAIEAEGELTGGEEKGDGAADDVQLDIKVKVAGQVVTAEEVRFLLEQGSTLVFFRDRWIEVDRSILREALRVLERAQGGRLKRIEAVSFALGLGAVGRLQLAEARSHGWLRGLVENLRRSNRLPAGTLGSIPGFTGKLRDYQSRGAAWLRFLSQNGFGALLADDMGLGKTIETIAWLCWRSSELKRTESRAPALILAPLSIIANWRHELKRFAPELSVYVHHGDFRLLASRFAKTANDVDVVLTSYTLFVRDYALFRDVKWDSLIIDEAQAIKNPDTQTARAVCALQPPCRIALTGTPVENSVADLWSLEKFLNPGFLPDRPDFNENYVRPITLDPHAAVAKKLRHALEPFILRRLKSEPGVAAELGPKREIREFCELPSRLRLAYDAELEDWRATERSRGDIFGLITRLKLICDGVEQSRDATGVLSPKLIESGKFERLVDLLSGIFAAGESALIFTQYTRVGSLLREALFVRLARRFPFLHGNRTPAQREHDIAEFNASGPNALILSLRAGGFGLNLTKATHVIHYDRWWNPAVEAQATDRAHRIGQTGTVFVHLFISTSTLEERIDELLERKLAAAGSLVASGEAFFSSISRAELEDCL